MFRRRGSKSADEKDSIGDGMAADANNTASETKVLGPIDSEHMPNDGVIRLDFGSLLVPGAEGMEIRLEVDQTTDLVVAVTVIDGTSAMQLMPFAAPRHDGIWDEVRGEIQAGLAAQGTVEEVDGSFGKELRSTVSVTTNDGSIVQQPVRFLGVDGPRWFVRAVISGEAGGHDMAPALEAVLRSTVVVRGSEPMAPGDPLVLSFPVEVPDGVVEGSALESAEPSRKTLPLPERGPEITEIR